jgi:sulfatase maturation enzyme AslB (radical SAM superfamily)
MTGKNNDKKYFPIQTSTACRLKWSWSTLYLNSGKTASCHRASISEIPEDFDNFHNTDIKIKAREDMLQGNWPRNGCEYCKNIEDSGGTSDRQFQNQIPNAYPPELDLNNSLTVISPTIVEVFFSNTCNLACVYCTASLSSAIQAENKKFNGAIIPELDYLHANNQYKNLIPKFWNWLKEHGQSLQRLQILGGEPFLQKDVDQLIDFFGSNPNPELEFNLISNLSLNDLIFLSYVEKLTALKQRNCVKRIDIQCSIDCWGAAQSYIRHGINLDLFEKNIKKLVETTSFRLGLLTTVTSLSIPTMVDLAKKRIQWQGTQEIFWYMHLVLPATDSVFDPTIFDYKIYKPYIDQVYQHLPKKTWDDQQTFEIFDGIVSKLKINCKTDIKRQQYLLDYLTKNDQRRNTNWKTSFPWLDKEFRKNNVV